MSLLVYGIKKYIDYRTARVFEMKVGALKNIQALRIDTLIRVEWYLKEAEHCANHIRTGTDDGKYRPRCEDFARKVREESRAGVAVVGNEMVDQVRLATDALLRYLKSGKEDDFSSWAVAFDSTMRLANAKFMDVG